MQTTSQQVKETFESLRKSTNELVSKVGNPISAANYEDSQILSELEKMKLFVTLAFASCSAFYVLMNAKGGDTSVILVELQRVKGYFEKIKTLEDTIVDKVVDNSFSNKRKRGADHIADV